LAPRDLKAMRWIGFCMVRILSPLRSAGVFTSRALLVSWRKPFSMKQRFLRPFGSSRADSFAPTGPSKMASAPFSLVMMKGRSKTLNSGTRPVTGDAVGATISRVPMRTASVARTSSPSWELA